MKILIQSLCVVGCFAGSLQAQQAAQSDKFVDSVGINIHLSNGNSLYYTNFALIENSLVSLGIRHTRDALVATTNAAYYDRHNELGALGVKGLFVTQASQSSSLLESWPSNVSKSFEGYEFPNEMDEPTNGLALLKGFLPVLASASSLGSAPNAIVVGPSLTLSASYAKLGNISQYFDFGNLHTYFGGRNPGTIGWGALDATGNRYGSLPYALDYEKLNSGTKPIYLTETGYDFATGYVNYVNEAVAAIYLPRLLLESWNGGVARTYIYELLTGQATTTQDFGLLRPDGSQRPSFAAIKNLMNILEDPGAAFTPSSLPVTINGGDSSLHKLLLQKRDGTYYLALWVEKPCWEPDTHYRLAVAPEAINLTTSTSFASAVMHQWDEAGNVTDTTLSPGSSFPLVVTDKLMLLQLTQAATTSFRVTLTIAPSVAGSVTFNPTPSGANNSFQKGTFVDMVATPHSGYVFTGWSQFLTSTASAIHVTMNNNLTLTANFTCSYSIESSSVNLSAAAGSTSTSYTTGSTCVTDPISSATWLSASTSKGALVLTTTSNVGAARTATVTVGNTSVAVTQAASAKASIAVKIAGNIAGSYMYIDGIPYFNGALLHWTPGTQHVLTPPAAQSVGGTVYLFRSWSGGASGATALTVTAPTVDVTYSSNLIAGHYLNVLASSGGTVSVSSAGTNFGGTAYYYPTDTVKVVANPSTSCSFVSWKGTNSNSRTLSLIMSASDILIPTFTCN